MLKMHAKSLITKKKKVKKMFKKSGGRVFMAGQGVYVGDEYEFRVTNKESPANKLPNDSPVVLLGDKR